MAEEKNKRPQQQQQAKKNTKQKKLCLLVMAVTAVSTIVLVTLGLTVFHARDAKVQVHSVYLETFAIQANALRMALLVDLTVHNPNREELRDADCVTRLFYYGDPVGLVRLRAGNIKPKGSEKLSLLLVVEAGDRVLLNAKLPGNIASGQLPVVATTTVAGIVEVLGVLKHHAVSTSHCQISICVTNATIQSFFCRPGLRI